MDKKRPAKTKKSNFKFEHFINLPDVYEMQKYAAKTLGKSIGSGGERIVWKITSNGHPLALKIAKEYNGYYQNLAEIERSKCFAKSLYFTNIIKHDPEGKWLLAEFAKPITGKIFQNKTGINIAHVDNSSLRAAYGKNQYQEFFKNMVRFDPNYKNNKWLLGLIDISKKCGFDILDLTEENFGLIGNRIVVVDYGFEEASPRE